MTLQVEQDTPQTRAHLMDGGGEEPDLPLRLVLPKAEIILHRGMQLSIRPDTVRASTRLGDYRRDTCHLHFNTCLRVRVGNAQYSTCSA